MNNIVVTDNNDDILIVNDTMRGSSGWSYQHGWRGNWGGDWRRRSDWQSFEYDQFSQMPPRYLDDERRRRQDSTWRYDRWRRDGAQGAPPPTANPVIQNPAPVSSAETSPPAPAPRAVPRDAGLCGGGHDVVSVAGSQGTQLRHLHRQIHGGLAACDFFGWRAVLGRGVGGAGGIVDAFQNDRRQIFCK